MESSTVSVGSAGMIVMETPRWPYISKTIIQVLRQFQKLEVETVAKKTRKGSLYFLCLWLSNSAHLTNLDNYIAVLLEAKQKKKKII